MTASGARLDELAQLEEQRRFLLRSLDDLEAEHAAGDIDERDYQVLRADYTSRAAEVIRRIEGGVAAIVAPVEARRAAVPRWRRPVIWAAVVAAAAGSGLLVARSAGEREAGQTMTGNAGVASPEQGRIAQLLDRAREATGTDPLSAIEAYDQVVKLDPTIAEAWTYGGWQLRIVASQAPEAQRAQLLNGAERRLVQATEQDPTYPDPVAFLAVMALRDFNDPAGAKTYLEQLAKLQPGPDIVALTASLRDELGMAPVPTGGGPTTTE